MTLFELHVDVGRIADALEKIVFLLEKLVYPPKPPEVKVEQATLDDIHYPSEEEYIRQMAEMQEFAARYHVVPGSEAFGEALLMWEEEQKRLYGDEWQPPKDWRSVFAQAEREVREQSAAAAARDQ